MTFRANEVVVGLALNILAGGMTISLMKAIFGTRGSIVGHGIVGLPAVQLPVARELGWLWVRLISGFTPLVYVAFLLVPLLILFYRRTRLGLYIRVVGEKPEAAEALGISISRVRYISSLLCGLLAGLAGAHLSLGYITMFTENMSSGPRFHGGRNPDLLQRRSAEGSCSAACSSASPTRSRCGCRPSAFPSYLVLAVPYLVALAALFALSYRARPKIIRETLESMQPRAVASTNQCLSQDPRR